MCTDQANFTDPDGRAGIPFLQDFMKSFLGECVIGSLQVLGTVAGVGAMMQIGGTIGNVVSGAISIGTTTNSIRNMAQLANQGSGVIKTDNPSTVNSVSLSSGEQQRFTAHENASPEHSDIVYEQLEILGAPTNGGIWIQYEYRNNSNQFQTDWVNYNKGIMTNMNGTSYQGKPFANNEYNKGSYDYVNAVFKDLEVLRNSGDEILMHRLADLQSSKFRHIISMPTVDYNNVTPEGNRTTEINKGVRMGSNCFFDPRKQPRGTPMRKSAAGLAHELLGHSWDIEMGLWDINQTENGIWMYEVRAVNIENRARALGPVDTRRTTYGGEKIDEKFLD